MPRLASRPWVPAAAETRIQALATAAAAANSDATEARILAVDVHAARAGGLPVWLVPGGASGRENPLDAGPDRALNDFGELADLLPGASP